VTPPPSVTSNRSAGRHTTGILVIILTAQLMVVLDGTVVNIALPHIRSALHMAPVNLSWVLNAYALTFGGFLLLGARAGDLRGRKRVLVAGVVLFTVASAVAGVSTDSAMLLVARAAQGMGGALASPSALALMTITFQEGRERTRAIAWYTAVSIGGSAVGLVLGGVIVDLVSWRWIFYLNLPVGVVLVVVALSWLPETEGHPGTMDIAGALTSTVGMGSLVYGLVRASTAGWGDALTVVAFVAGVVLLAAFVLIERRASTPITPLHLFADRNRVTSYLVRLLLVGASFGMFFFLSQYFQEVAGYSPIKAGLAFVPLTIFIFAASQLSAHVLTGRVPGKVQMVVGLACSAIGLIGMAQLTVHTSYWYLFGCMILFGSGNGLAFVTLTNLGLSGVRHEDAGAASGVLNAAQQIGGALGLAILVTVFGAASRAKAAGLATSVTGFERFARPFVAGAERAYWVAGGLAAVSFVLVAIVRAPDEPGTDDIELAEAETAGGLL
jgi:EmrB/QacA subfamily drug resistance transporter